MSSASCRNVHESRRMSAHGNSVQLLDHGSKSPSPPTKSEEILFINVTSTAPTNPKVQTSIRRHVMKHFRRAQKTESHARNPTPSPPPPPAFGSQRSAKRKRANQSISSNGEVPRLQVAPPSYSRPDLQQALGRTPEELNGPLDYSSFEEAQLSSDDTLSPEEDSPDSQVSVLSRSNSALISRCLAVNGDPFVRYPTAVSGRTLRLLAHVFDDRSVNLKPYRDAFFAVALLDAATFYQYLANFVLYLPNVRSLPAAREYEKTEALIHQDQAIKLIIKKMGNRKDVVSDGMIGAVVGMACQAHMLQDIPLWRAHMDGLKTMIRLRGGVDSLDTNPILRKAFTWLDVNSASTQDALPNFELPLRFVEYRPSFGSNIMNPSSVIALSTLFRNRFPNHVELVEIFEEISQFFIHVQEQSIKSSRRVWFDSNFAGRYINPYIYRLLHIRSDCTAYNKGSHIPEAFRLGMVLSLAEVRREFQIYPVISQVYIAKLRLLMESEALEWNELGGLGFWITAMGLVEAPDQDRNFFLKEWDKASMMGGLKRFEDAERVLLGLPWLDEVHGRRLRMILS